MTFHSGGSSEAPLASGPTALQSVLRLLARRARAIVAVAVAVTAVAIAVPMLQAPKYTAIASIMINPRQAAAASPIGPAPTTPGAPDSALVDSEIEVMGSDQLLARVARQLELAGDAEFNPALDRGFSLRRSVSGLLREAGMTAKSGASESTGEEIVVATLDAAVSVRRRSLSYVVDVAASSQSPRKAARIANAVVEEYRAFQREARAESVKSANVWLTERLSQLRGELQQREEAVEAYRASAGLLSTAGSSLAEQETQATQQSVLNAQARLTEKRARYSQAQAILRDGGSSDSVADVLNSSVVRDLRQRESDLGRRQADLEGRYGALHPSVVQGKAELDSVRAQISAETGRILTSMRNEVAVAEQQLRDMRGSLGAARSGLLATNDAEVKLRELEREAEGARTAYRNFQDRAHEIVGLEQVAATEIRDISKARSPSTPSSPHLPTVLMTAICIGLGVGLLIGLILEQLDDTFASAEDIEHKLGVPAIASIPLLSPHSMRMLAPNDRHPAGYLVERPLSAFAEAFRVMQTSAVYAGAGGGRRVFAVTSALPNEGKTTTAFCLARSFAASGARTLIVDCDLRRRSLNALLDIEPRQGLVQALKGEAPWRSLVGSDEATAVHVMPASADNADAPAVFSSGAMERFLKDVVEVYDVVILDCPPVLSVADARIIAALADLVFVVVRWGKTPVAAVRAAVHQLETTHVNVHGVALNFVDVRAPGRRSYGDSLYYTQSEGSYYVS